MLRLGVLSVSVAVLSAAGQGGTTAPAPYKGRIIRPVVKVFGANPVRTGVSTNDYWDDGADCSDHVPFDMDLNFHVAAGGDVVRLDKPGKYTIKYYCTNDRGMSAVPKTRTVIVAKSYVPQCDELTISGTSSTAAGTYALTKDINNGKLVYKQQTATRGGKINYLYSFISDRAKDHVHLWVVNAFNPLNKFVDVIKNPTGLKVKSSASKPEGIKAGWRQWNGHGWGQVPLKITCTKGKALNRDATDFEVDAAVELAGYTVNTFNEEAREKFGEATAIALDVATEDVHIISVTADNKFRRRLGVAAEAGSANGAPGVRVSFAVKTSEADVAKAVDADLHKDVFDETLYSRMGEQGLHASRVLLDAKSVVTHQPTGGSGALKYGLMFCGVAAAIAVAYRSGKGAGAASVAVTDFASEEEKATLT